MNTWGGNVNPEESMNPAASELAFRPFEEQDFEAAARLFSEAWCEELGEPGARITGELAVASYLAQSSWGCLAVRNAGGPGSAEEGAICGAIANSSGIAACASAAKGDGAGGSTADEVLGIVLSAEKGQLLLAGDWKARVDALRAELAEDPQLAATVDLEMGGIAEERALGARFEATGAAEADVEIKLLIVSPAAQGLGLGKQLLSRAARHARNNGAGGYFLLTDDACDVSFYDHLGLRQAMRKTSEADWPGSAAPADDFSIYVYAHRFD